MPTYQYACTACGDRLEVVQSFTDAALTECPACQGALRKVFSAVGVVFKGSGFYKTDSRQGDSKADKGSEATKTDAVAKTDSAPQPAAKAADAKSASTGTSTTPAAKSA